MATSDLKTKPNAASVDAFLKQIPDEDRRRDCTTVLGIMKKATRKPPRMWGAAIVGFGEYHYKYASGREGDWFLTGFSPRKQDLTLYFTDGLHRHEARLKKLGKHRTGKSCLYVKRLADIDLAVLTQMIADSIRNGRTPGGA